MIARLNLTMTSD